MPYSIQGKTVDISRLAWCARVSAENSLVTVLRGPWVEHREDAFFEGAWDGDLVADDFDQMSTFLGSGGRTTDQGVVFATPTHTMERLQYILLPDCLIVSNSLAFLLAQSDDALDPNYGFYTRDLVSYVRGKGRHRTSIPTRSGNRIQLAYFCNLLVDHRLRVTKLPKKTVRAFCAYSDYVGFLRQTVARLYANASDERRKVVYSPLTTISSGYDSPACSTLAREIGCHKAITFPRVRSELNEFEDADDSGRDIADALGLEVSEFDRTAYLQMTNYPEAEFLAYGSGGNDVIYTAAEESMTGALLFTGFHGYIWERVKSAEVVAENIIRTDTSGSSLSEIRLRIGFIHFAVPFVGCTSYPSIFSITNSDEMKPWSLDQNYDKPIARRLVEEAGVPRTLFGQEKKAVGQPFYPAPGIRIMFNRPLRQIMTETSYRALLAEHGQYDSRLGVLRRYRFAALHRLYHPVPWRLRLLSRRWGFELPDFKIVTDSRYEFPITLHDFAFNWAIERIIPRYKI